MPDPNAGEAAPALALQFAKSIFDDLYALLTELPRVCEDLTWT